MWADAQKEFLVNLSIREWGVYIFVSVVVRSLTYAKDYRVPATRAQLTGASKRRNEYGWLWGLSPLMNQGNFELSQKKLELSLLLNFVLHSTLTEGRAMVGFCDCWVRRGQRWEALPCHCVPMGKTVYTVAQRFLSLPSYWSCLQPYTSFYYRLEYLPVSCFWTVDCKPDLPCHWVKQSKSMQSCWHICC